MASARHLSQSAFRPVKEETGEREAFLRQRGMWGEGLPRTEEPERAA